MSHVCKYCYIQLSRAQIPPYPNITCSNTAMSEKNVQISPPQHFSPTTFSLVPFRPYDCFFGFTREKKPPTSSQKSQVQLDSLRYRLYQAFP